MKKTEISIVIIERLSEWFEMSDIQKQQIYQKLIWMKDENRDAFMRVILEYDKKQQKSSQNLLQYVKQKQKNIDELTEKKNLSQEIENLFDNL